MPRDPAALERIRDERRADILAAAERCFAAHGFAPTKISAIAKEAGLSHGLVYHYFESKEALLEALFEERFQLYASMLDEALARGESPTQQLEAYIGVMVESADPPHPFGTVVLHALMTHSFPDWCRETITATARTAFDRLVAVVAEGQKSGELTDTRSAEELATALIAVLRGYTLMRSAKVSIPYVAPSAATILRMVVADPLASSSTSSEERKGQR